MTPWFQFFAVLGTWVIAWIALRALTANTQARKDETRVRQAHTAQMLLDNLFDGRSGAFVEFVDFGYHDITKYVSTPGIIVVKIVTLSEAIEGKNTGPQCRWILNSADAFLHSLHRIDHYIESKLVLEEDVKESLVWLGDLMGPYEDQLSGYVKSQPSYPDSKALDLLRRYRLTPKPSRS